MNESIGSISRTQAAGLTVVLTLLISFGSALAEGPVASSSTALLAPPAQEDQLILKRRLQTAKGDIESFSVFAENFRKNGDTETLAQLQVPVDDFLKKHVDNLLDQNADYSTLDTTRLTAEILFIKTRLFMSMNRKDDARKTLAEIKNRFGSYQEITVELPEKTTTLNEGIRQLDAELATTAKVQ